MANTVAVPGNAHRSIDQSETLKQTVALIDALESSIVDGWVRTPFFDWKLKGSVDYLRLNARYRWCQKRLADARADADWRTYIALHLPQFREDAFYRIQQLGEIGHPLHNQLVGEIWTDPQILHSSSCFVLSALRCDAPHDTNDLMTNHELTFLNALPTTVTAYRAHLNWNQLGPCWTLNEQVAQQFGAAYGWDILTTIHVPRDSVLVYFDRRNESELVIQDHSNSEIVAERNIE